MLKFDKHNIITTNYFILSSYKLFSKFQPNITNDQFMNHLPDLPFDTTFWRSIIIHSSNTSAHQMVNFLESCGNNHSVNSDDCDYHYYYWKIFPFPYYCCCYWKIFPFPFLMVLREMVLREMVLNVMVLNVMVMKDNSMMDDNYNTASDDGFLSCLY